jgi:hypothetical protein
MKTPFHARALPAGVVSAAILISLSCLSFTTAAEPASLDRYIELLRSDMKAKKTAVLTEALALSDAEGKTFWPIYREYEVELATWGDKRYATIKQYAKAYNAEVVDDAIAEDLAKRFMDLQSDRLALMHKYYKKLAGAVSPMRAAQFLQAEHQISLIVDLEIASEVPFLEASQRTAQDK